VQIYLSLESTMSVLTKNHAAMLKPVPSLVALATSQIVLQSESCYREVWLVFDQRQIVSMDQFWFGDNLILLATCSHDSPSPLLSILLQHYFSEPHYFPLFTFESVGRTWRMRRFLGTILFGFLNRFKLIIATFTVLGLIFFTKICLRIFSLAHT